MTPDGRQAEPAPVAAWSDADLRSPHALADKPSRVRAMFGAIASSYDLNNRLHSLGRDQAWRRAAVRDADVRPGDRVLDVACGTGDLTALFAATGAARVVGCDFTPAMLDRARAKLRALPERARAKIEYAEGDAMALAFPDRSFDVVSIAFGIRNVADPARALAEFARVLAPGGRLVVLEFDTPRFAPARWLNDAYCGWVMPRTATLISGDRSGAYKYLPRSVGTFMSRDALREAIGRAGFVTGARPSHPPRPGADVRPLTFGICACYRAERAESSPSRVP